MSVGPNPIDSRVIEQERQRLSRRLDEIARLCEANVPAQTFYEEMLKRLLESLAAPAGAIWIRSSQGNLVLQYQINLREVGLDRNEEARKTHLELLRHAVTQPRPIHLLPQSGAGESEEGKVGAGNPTDHMLLLTPMVSNGNVSGLIEVFQGANRPQNAVPGFLQFMGLMADLGVRYQRNQMIGQLSGQQQLWTQLETFSRLIHASLHPVEVAYAIANESRRLIECDRVSVAIRQARSTKIEAVSGSDTVERRSKLVRLMRDLCDSVLDWGEKLVFRGVQDDSLPPKVLDALDAYLAESPSKLLVVQPLDDERQGKGKEKKPTRSALLVECFEPPDDPQQYLARMDVVAKHATSALYNAVEYRRIPMRWFWLPLAKAQEGLGGQARAISALVVILVALLGSALYFLPYPLKMESEGKLLPEIRRGGFPPRQGMITRFEVKPGDVVREGQVLAYMRDPELANQLHGLATEAMRAQKEAEALMAQASKAQGNEAADLKAQAMSKKIESRGKTKLFLDLKARTGFTNWEKKEFTLRAPRFTTKESQKLSRRQWTVLNSDFVEEWTNRRVTPADSVIRLGAKPGPWGIMLEIPHKNIGQVLHAMHGPKVPRDSKDDTPYLFVDFLLRTDPTKTYKGKLKLSDIAGEANPSRTDNDEPQSVVLAWVRIEDEDIPEDAQLPRELLLAGTDVRAKIRCGNHRMGYSLFYGVWEFVYEKVVFFF